VVRRVIICPLYITNAITAIGCQRDQISDHQQSWGYEDGPWKGPGPPLLVVADFLKEFWISNTFKKLPL
jgi:hypothetical protein